jgi:phage terminase large subunit-like protein
VPGLKLEDFYGKRCIIALDLASKVDVAAKIMLFHEDGKRYVFGKYYLPESAVERGNPNYDVYQGWSRNPTVDLVLTPGDIIDFEFIERDLIEDRGKFQVIEFPYDPYQATELATRMIKEGLPMIEVGATVRNFSEAMKSLDALILSGGIYHNGDPMLDWMIGNVYGKKDSKDNVYPRKIRNENKIDGAVALIMALGRDMVSVASEQSSTIEIW